MSVRTNADGPRGTSRAVGSGDGGNRTHPSLLARQTRRPLAHAPPRRPYSRQESNLPRPLCKRGASAVRAKGVSVSRVGRSRTRVGHLIRVVPRHSATARSSAPCTGLEPVSPVRLTSRHTRCVTGRKKSARRESHPPRPPWHDGASAARPRTLHSVSGRDRSWTCKGIRLARLPTGWRRQSTRPSGSQTPRNRSGQVSDDTRPRRYALVVRVSAVERVRGRPEGPAGRPDRLRAARIRLTDLHENRSSGPRPSPAGTEQTTDAQDGSPCAAESFPIGGTAGSGRVRCRKATARDTPAVTGVVRDHGPVGGVTAPAYS